MAGISSGGGQDIHINAGTSRVLSYSLINSLTDNGDDILTTNVISGDPLLDPLADNGGPAPTHALKVGSPAIDAGGAQGFGILSAYSYVVDASKLRGVTADNTDDDGRLFLKVISTDITGTNCALRIYKDAARTQLIAHTDDQWSTSSSHGNVELAVIADNGSGLGGSIFVDPQFSIVQMGGNALRRYVSGLGSIVITTNAVDEDGLMYMSLSYDDSGPIVSNRMDFYSDSGRTFRAGYVDWYTNGVPGWKTITADNGSGMGGQIHVDDPITTDDNTSGRQDKMIPQTSSVRINFLEYDQRGEPFDRVSMNAADIGAYEVPPPPMGSVFMVR